MSDAEQTYSKPRDFVARFLKGKYSLGPKLLAWLRASPRQVSSIQSARMKS